MEKAFIIGNPRSGTTLLRLMLNSHPNIVSPPECGFLQWWYEKYNNWNVASNTFENVAQFITDLQTSKKIETWELNYEALQNEIILKHPDSYSDLGELIYKFYGNLKRSDFNVIADKNNYYITHLETLKKIWPDAKYILMIRDGRDVACSYKNIEALDTKSPYKPILPSDIESIAHEWVTNNKNGLDFFETLKTTSTLITRYEDILCDTKIELEKICTFLGETFSGKMLDYYLDDQHGGEPESTRDWKRKIFEKPDINNIGKYKDELSKSDIEEFNKIGISLLNKFDYSL